MTEDRKDLVEQIKEKITKSGRGAAIKLYQDSTGAGPTEATDYVDKLIGVLRSRTMKEDKERGRIAGGIATIAVIAIILVVAVVYFALTSKKTTPVSISNVEWSEIDAIYNTTSKYTDLQKNEAWKRYQGKRVQWSGTVMAVSDGFGGISLRVKMRHDTLLVPDVDVALKDGERSKALVLKQGDSVVFAGILANWGSILPITLRDGEIIQSTNQ